MRPLSAAELLSAWEQGMTGSAFGRMLPLLATACPDLPLEAIRQLSIGQRDARLLKLREWTFGSQLPSVADCPRCNERLEWTIDTDDLEFGGGTQIPEQLIFETGDYSIKFRLPNSLDLEAVAEAVDSEAATIELLKRCVLEARVIDREVSPGELNEEVTSGLTRRMSELDPQAEVQIDLTCPSCGHGWEILLDVETFFWAELNAWARRMLSEVHILACAYGWREADILSLTPLRRQYYLDMVNG